jgi:hypothetical protein
MAPRSKSPNRRQRKREQRQREDSIEWGNDEMSHNRLDSFQRSDFDYFREIQPKLHELKIAGAAVQCEGKKVEEAIGKIVECLQQHGDAVSVVGDSFEREHEREKEAEELKITIRQLRRMKDEESTERDNEIIELRKSATAGQRKEEELKGQQSQLESDYNKKLEDLRIAEEVNKKAMEKTFQQKLEQEIQRKIGVHSSKVEMLERQVIDLQKDNSQLRKETESLAKTLEEKELALEGLRGRNERLKTKLKECQDDFAEGEQDEKY